MQGIVHVELLLPQLVKLSEDGRSQHVLYLDLASSLRVKEEEEFADGGDHIKRIEGFLKALQLGECWHQLEDIILKIFFFQVPEPR